MTQKKLSLAAMAVCLAFGAAVPATAAQYGEISRSNKESVQVTQEVALTALIARYADPREGQWMAQGIWENGDRTVREFMSGQRTWRQPFGFVYSPDFIWNIQGREKDAIASVYLTTNGALMPYKSSKDSNGKMIKGLDYFVTFLSVRINQGGMLYTSNLLFMKYLQSHWYGMVFATASVNFVARLSEEISNQLEGNVYASINEAYIAVGQIIEEIGEDRLNQEFLSILNDSLMGSYRANQLEVASDDKQAWSMLTSLTTNKGLIVRLGKEGWEYSKGTLYFSPEKGVIAGSPVVISISNGRDSTFVTKGKGRASK